MSEKNPEKIAKAKAASRRKVIDPTTKNEVVIQDVDGDFEDSIRRPTITVPKAGINSDRAPLPNQMPGVPAPHLPEGDGEQYRTTLDDLAPPEANPDKTQDLLHRSKNHEVIYHPLPIAELKDSFYALENTIFYTTIAATVGLGVLNWFFLGGGIKGLIGSAIAGVILSCGIHLWLRRVQEDANAVNWDAEKKRATAAVESLVPESVEWMNSLVGIVWNLINPEMFAAMADTLEDVMQASVPPALIQNVKVSSLGLGDQPFKILSLRSLPSADSDEGHGKQAASGQEISEEDKAKKREQRELEGEDDPNMKYCKCSDQLNGPTNSCRQPRSIICIFCHSGDRCYWKGKELASRGNLLPWCSRTVRRSTANLCRVERHHRYHSTALPIDSQPAIPQEPYIYVHGPPQD